MSIVAISVLFICQAGLDLPLPPVRLGSPPASAPHERFLPDDDADDPRDTPPPTFYGEEIDTQTDSIVYVVDLSGSMDYQYYDNNTPLARNIDKAKAELVRSISGLANTFRFNVVGYNCGIKPWKPKPVDANRANKAAATAWVMGLKPSGATGTGPAVAAALASDRDNTSIVLLTDGAPNCGVPSVYVHLSNNPGIPPGERDTMFFEAHRAVIRKGNTQGATISVFGIRARAAYRAFCKGVAQDSGGSYYDVP